MNPSDPVAPPSLSNASPTAVIVGTPLTRNVRVNSLSVSSVSATPAVRVRSHG
jgi:hypothetical protein